MSFAAIAKTSGAFARQQTNAALEKFAAGGTASPWDAPSLRCDQIPACNGAESSSRGESLSIRGRGLTRAVK